ncbi:aggregation promoting factor surface protein [Lactobacillus sp. ESL0785]|uniref:aggregation-promoting factor C-terminal-like domain-containing protein n=1 Tax=Lactobacillus sp. ESL0785 TaxID=2983232 RepID=UPI0023F77E2B|nr:aggregation promoting factor surface protein [Lactobacillus sp. ESL0785]WEV71008.1 aggregation promoting factor surface protein [Lactobacillus sp. ESL0785]
MNTLKEIKSFILKLIAALTLACSFATIIQVTTTNTSTTTTVQAAYKLSKKERAARHWIVMHESGGNYYARNGACYGKYQLNLGYLHGDYSKKNQDQTANNYVYGRYGSWVNAKIFWQAHHWY